MESSTRSWLTILSAAVLLVAISLRLFQFQVGLQEESSPDVNDASSLDAILAGLLRLEIAATERQLSSPQHPARVAVGFGACKDVFASALPLFRRFGASPPAPGIELDHHASIADKKQLEEGVAYFFRHGAAAERYVSDKAMFRRLVETADELPGVRHVLGGNAPVMANRIAKEGGVVLLAARLSNELRAGMHGGVKTVVYGKGEEEEGAEEDDIHLILEYAKDEAWEHLVAPRANRYIIHSDADNPWITSLEPLVKEMSNFDPHLLVIGGLQMLDNFPGFEEGERTSRLTKLANFLAHVPFTTLTHFEMASFADESLLSDLVETVLIYSDSLGMNEQELPNLYSILHSGSLTLISDPYPRVAGVLDQMRAVFNLLKTTPREDGKRPLTRLHVHTLAYQAIMTLKDSAWKDSRGAAAKASLTANRHICGEAEIDVGKAKILMDDGFSSSREAGSRRIDFDPEHPVSCWDEEDVEICVAPVLVCLKVKQTAGGGDNISSAGLLYNI